MKTLDFHELLFYGVRLSCDIGFENERFPET